MPSEPDGDVLELDGGDESADAREVDRARVAAANLGRLKEAEQEGKAEQESKKKVFGAGGVMHPREVKQRAADIKWLKEHGEVNKWSPPASQVCAHPRFHPRYVLTRS
jgi:hypothetical protein